MQVYSQKPSSYPNQQRQETFGAVTRLTRVTPNFSTQWFTRFLRWHARLVHHRTFLVLPWKAWFTGIAQIKGTARAGDDAASYLLLRSPQKMMAAKAGLPLVQRIFPRAPGEAGAIRSRPQNELPDPGMLGYTLCQHTTATRAVLGSEPAFSSCLPSI